MNLKHPPPHTHIINKFKNVRYGPITNVAVRGPETAPAAD